MHIDTDLIKRVRCRLLALSGLGTLILNKLAEKPGTLCVADVTRALDAPASQVSLRITALRNAGFLCVKEVDGRHVFYRVDEEQMGEALGEIENLDEYHSYPSGSPF